MCFPHLSKRLSMLCTRLGERVLLSILNVYTGKNFTQKSLFFLCMCAYARAPFLLVLIELHIRGRIYP